MKNPKKINLALIGYGSWGKKILKESKKLKNAKIKYLCSPSIQEENLTQEIGVVDYKQITNFSDVDGVIIASPAKTHYEIASYFIKKNQNIMVEKPLGVNLDEVRKIEELLFGKKLVFKVGYIYKYNPAFLLFRKICIDEKNLNSVKLMFNNFQNFSDDQLVLEWMPHALSMIDSIYGIDGLNFSFYKRKKKIKLDSNFRGINIEILIGRGFENRKRMMIIKTNLKTITFNELSPKKVVINNKETIDFPTYSKNSPLRTEVQSFVDAIKNKNYSREDLGLSLTIANVINSIKLHG